MTQDQHAHMDRIQKAFFADHSSKFVKGAEEHKTLLHEDFTPLQLLAMAKEEVLDLVSYIYTLEEVIKNGK